MVTVPMGEGCSTGRKSKPLPWPLQEAYTKKVLDMCIFFLYFLFNKKKNQLGGEEVRKHEAWKAGTTPPPHWYTIQNTIKTIMCSRTVHDFFYKQLGISASTGVA